MYIKRVRKQEYESIVGSCEEIFFNSCSFIELNRDKVDDVLYLIAYKENSPRCGFIFGVKNGVAKAPFSAPFAMPVFIKKKVSIEYYDLILSALDEYARLENWQEIRFTLPPLFYQEHELTGWINALHRTGYVVETVDINYAIDLKKNYVPDYDAHIAHNARKNLKIALASGLELYQCESEDEIKEAYTVIQENRQSKGYPLRMTYSQVKDTLAIVGHELFLVKKDGFSIAAALIYHVTADTVQVIYWGDRPGYGNLKPINYLSYQLIQYYGKKGLRYLDIGPSTEDSIPNVGLCDFKESIGCERGLKFTFTKCMSDI